jgi:hypothetical protein
VSGIGNIATINLNANASQVLYGNGVFAAVAGGGGSSISNGNSNVNIPAANGNINLTAVGNTTMVITGTGVNIAGTLNSTGNANVLNLGTARVIATGNISGTQFISNIAIGTAPFIVTSTTQVANLSVATSGTAGTVTTAAQPNITSVGTLTSLIVSGNANITNTNLVKYRENVIAGGNTTATLSPNVSAGTIFNYTANTNFTFDTLTNAVAGSGATVIITQDATGSRVMTSTMKFLGNSKTLSTAASSIDIVTVFYDGTTYYAALGKGYA